MAEDEDLQRIKEWWKNNGTSIVVGIAIGIAGIAGFNGWNLYTANARETASAIYEQLRLSAAEDKLDAVAELGRELRDDYDSTPYAATGALLEAAVQYQGGNVDSARRALEWVLDNGAESGVVHAARIRLAYLELGEGNADTVLALTSVKGQGGFESHYAELRAEALAAQGKVDESRQAYDEAIAALPSGSGYGPVLEARRNALGGGE